LVRDFYPQSSGEKNSDEKSDPYFFQKKRREEKGDEKSGPELMEE
jgi:hypothetical protein